MVTVNISRFPNVFPYNTVMLSCVASLAVEINISLNFTWKRINAENCYHGLVSFNDHAINTHYQSNITVREVNSSTYCYQCIVELDMEGLGNTQQTNDQIITVTCKLYNFTDNKN